MATAWLLYTAMIRTCPDQSLTKAVYALYCCRFSHWTFPCFSSTCMFAWTRDQQQNSDNTRRSASYFLLTSSSCTHLATQPLPLTSDFTEPFFLSRLSSIKETLRSATYNHLMHTGMYPLQTGKPEHSQLHVNCQIAD